jgi:DNA-binding protein HU-beta
MRNLWQWRGSVGLRKKDLVQRISAELEMSLADAEEIYDAIIVEMLRQLGEGDTVKLSGFGSFQIVSREPKLGRNPRTGERLKIPRHTSVKFKMGKSLLRVMNGRLT